MNPASLAEKFKESTSSDEKRILAEELVELNYYDKDLIRNYAKSLLDPEIGVRDISARGLINVPNEFQELASSFVSHLVCHENIEIRNLAGDILSNFGSNAVPPLIPYLEDENPDVRKFAIDIIGQVGEKKTIKTLIKLFSDEDINVSLAAIEAIGNIAYRNDDDSENFKELIEILTDFYDEEELKPQIINTLGKINRIDSINFLLNRLTIENDLFARITIIDSLALNAEDIETANNLLNLISEVPQDVQPIILKTVFAISNRTNSYIELPKHLRSVAYNSIMDEDKEISDAGLIALGRSYNIDDIPFLIKKVFENDAEEQVYIISNLITYSDNEVLTFFYKSFFDSLKDVRSFSVVDFISQLLALDIDIEEQKEAIIISSVLECIFNKNIGDQVEILEIMYNFDENQTSMILQEIYLGTDADTQKSIEEAVKQTNYSLIQKP